MSTFPKAYLRIDPNIDQVRPDLDRFIRLLCAANRQPRRGRFASREIALMVLGKTALTHHERRGDFTRMADGSLVVDGWEPWQEGDLTVAERMRRLRDRKSQRDAGVTATVTPDVTPPASPDRIQTSTPTLTTTSEIQVVDSGIRHQASGVGVDARSASRADFLAAEENDGRTDLDAFVDVRRRIPTPAQRALMDDYCATFDQTGPARAAQLIYANPDDPIGVLKADLAAFREERRAAAVAADVPKPIRRKGSGLSSVGEELAKMLREQDAAREHPEGGVA